MSRCLQFFRDTRALVVLSAPMVMGQLGQMLLQVVDAAMIGRVSVDALAAASFGSNFMHIFMLFGFGLCIPIHILVAESHGRKHPEEGIRWLFCGLVITGIYATVIAVGILLSLDVLGYFGQDPVVVELAHGYVAYLAASFVPLFAYQCFKNFSEARHAPWMPFAVLGVGFILNIALNWVFIYGHLGAPAMGLNGAGLATFIARIVMLLLIIYGLRGRLGQGIAALRALSVGAISWLRLRKWLSLGIPGAFQILFEAGAFILAAFMMGWISAATLAAHHIAVSYAALIFMVPLGMSFATCIQVAAQVGSRDQSALKRIVWTNITLSALFMGVCAVVTFALRNYIPLLFVESNEFEVIHLASSFLLVVALFHVFDGVQVVTLGAMRGLSDLKIPMLLLFVSFWPLGLLIGYLLAFPLGWGGQGIWWGLISGLFFAAALLLVRCVFLMKRHQVPNNAVI